MPYNRNHNNNNSGLGGWIAAIIMLFVFAPVGIFLLIKQLTATANSFSSSNGEWERRRGPQNRPGTGARYASDSVHTEPVNPYQAKGAEAQKAASQERPANTYAKPKRGKKKTPLEREQKVSKSTSIWLGIVAAIGFITGVSCLSPGLVMMYQGQNPGAVLALFIVGGIFSVGGIASLIGSRVLPRRLKRRRRYLKIIGETQKVDIATLARSSGKSENAVRRDIEGMLDDGYFGEGAYYDAGLDALIIDPSVAETLREVVEEVADAPDIPISEYDRILRELKTLDDKIEDDDISSKIERIGVTCAKIFEAVKINPEKLPQLRKFMNYYLPTTLKLLRAYSTLEKQGTAGENITGAKENITRVLGTLADGFDRQLDQLFRADVMDISADIEVLENMLTRDGLGGEESPFRTQTSTGEIF